MNLRYGYLKAPFIFANKYEIGRSLGFVDIETEQIVTYLKKENLITELTRNYYSRADFDPTQQKIPNPKFGAVTFPISPLELVSLTEKGFKVVEDTLNSYKPHESVEPSSLKSESIKKMDTKDQNQSEYNTSSIRRLLFVAFGDEDFTIFCYDFYPHVYQKFAAGMTFPQKIQFLVEYCNRNNLFDELLSLVKASNPNRFAEFYPYHRIDDKEPKIRSLEDKALLLLKRLYDRVKHDTTIAISVFELGRDEFTRDEALQLMYYLIEEGWSKPGPIASGVPDICITFSGVKKIEISVSNF